ncbi:hypothetical protein TIFTF001_025702 [Ficus carica]|uniref:Acyl-[acyl-carrier-protein] hydrolase n=1 Tax=Ficus carica TaxID=3494 RepID=A0AA88ANE2_FICCA|nr:hypothetical protein TIFTF001_025702 [Ficus carica]
MASMAAIASVRLTNFPRTLCCKTEESNNAAIGFKRRSVLAMASGGNARTVDTINGKKKNFNACDRGDVIEIDTWVDAEGKNGMRRDWIIRDYHTREIITRATSTWVIMNRETRRLSKIPEQVRQEVAPFYLHRAAIATENNDNEKIDKLTDETAERIRTGLAPRWSDMDANQHVNNVKYIGWILESVPMNVLEDYDLTSMTLEYRRECRQSNLLESLTSPTPNAAASENLNKHRPDLEYTHMLRMQADKAEIVRARTEWHSKQTMFCFRVVVLVYSIIETMYKEQLHFMFDSKCLL